VCCGAEAGSCLRLIDACITQLEAQGPARTCNESKEEEKDLDYMNEQGASPLKPVLLFSSLLLSSLELSDTQVYEP